MGPMQRGVVDKPSMNITFSSFVALVSCQFNVGTDKRCVKNTKNLKILRHISSLKMFLGYSFSRANGKKTGLGESEYTWTLNMIKEFE